MVRTKSFVALAFLAAVAWLAFHDSGKVPHVRAANANTIWLDQGEPLRLRHRGPAAATRGLASSQAKPLSMVSDDFTGDGIADLVAGYATPAGGVIALHRGNLDAFAPRSQATIDMIKQDRFPSPFLPDVDLLPVPAAPDFIVTGNFAGNGNTDILAASRDAGELYLFAADGKGGFAEPKTFKLAGSITALAGGRFGAASEYATVLVGVSGPGRSALSLYSGSENGLTPLGDIAIHDPATTIALGELDGDTNSDAAIVADHKIYILHGASRKLQSLVLPVSAENLALGTFLPDRSGHGVQIAIMGSDGGVHIAVPDTFDPRAMTIEDRRAIRQAGPFGRVNPLRAPRAVAQNEVWKIGETFPAAAPFATADPAPVMLRARISSHGLDDVVVLNGNTRQLVMISHVDTPEGASTFPPGEVLARNYTGAPVKAISTRVNIDGRPGLLVLHRGQVAPTVMMPLPDPVFTVNTTADTVDANPGNGVCADAGGFCSLRAAIMEANANALADTINVPAGTYTLTLTGANKEGFVLTPGNDTYGSLDIFAAVTIVGAVDGSGNPTTIIQAGTTSSNGIDKVFSVNPNGDLAFDTTFTNLEIRFGKNPGTFGGGAGTVNVPHGFGGGLFWEGSNGAAASGNLTVTNCFIHDNSTTDGDGGGVTVGVDTLTVGVGTGFATLNGNTIIQNNSAVESSTGSPGIGGGLWATSGTAIAVTGSKFLNNNATNVTGGNGGQGGGIFLFNPSNSNHQSVIHSSIINGNHAAGEGGGIFTGQGLLIDTATAITSNVAAQGGGIWSSLANETTTLTKVTITSNSAAGGSIANRGGGIFTGASGAATNHLTMHFSRLAGNSAALSGSNLATLESAGSTVNATNNWWGTNAAVNTISQGAATVSFDPFVVLTHIANPAKIRINQSTTLTGDMSKDNLGSGAALSGNLDTIVGLPITFDSAVLGSISGAGTALNPSAQATATYTAGGVGGLGSAHATVDQAVVSANSNLIASATEAGNTVTITTIGLHGFVTGQQVVITGVGVAGYNGTFIITGTTTTTFTYTNPIPGLGASSGGTASIGIVVLQPPTITKSFNPILVPVSATSTVTFSINSANVVTINGSFTDTLPSGLVVATPNGLANTCGGSVTATAGSGSISFSNPSSLPVGTGPGGGSPCTISVNVSAPVDNTYLNSVQILSTDAGNGNTSNASLTVISPPALAKSFGAATVPLSGNTSLTFTVTTSNVNLSLAGIQFTDTLPAGLVIASPNGLSSATPCGGTATAVAGSGSVSLSGATMAASASPCTFSVNVTGSTAGVKNNSVQISSTTPATTGNTANASITVMAPPTISKAFGAASVPLNGTTSLTFTITNPNATLALNGIAFSDTVPANLQMIGFGSAGDTCNGTVSPGASTVNYSAISVAASSSCIATVTVKGITAGDAVNTTSTITSTEGGTGTTSNTATLSVLAPPTISKAFGAASVPLNGTTSLTFTITNPAANTLAQTGVAFSDTLPTGLVVATPNGVTGNCGGGTVTATAGSTSISLSGGSVAVNSNCTVVVNVTGNTSGSYNNTTGTVSSTNGGTGATSNTANLIVAAPPSITKSFGAATIPVSGSTSLQFSITNPLGNVTLNGIGFTDNLPAGLVVATPNGSTGSCGGGTITAVAGSGSASLSGATLAANVTCTFSINVTGSTAGAKNNSVVVSSTEGGTGNTSNASVTVVAPPAISKAFGAPSVPLGGSTSLTFTINNPNGGTVLTGVAFSDTLPSATGTLVVATPNGISSTCGGTATATAGSNSITLTGASVSAGGSCTLAVNVTGTAAGDANNTTAAITSTNGGTGVVSNTATLKVVAPPTISKAFGAASVTVGGTTSLTFTITNPAANTAAETGVAFTDALPAGLAVATPNGLTNSCGGTVTAVAAGTSITLTGGTIATNSNCTVVVNVTGVTPGLNNNTTGTVSSTNGGTGATSNTASITVASPPSITKSFGLGSIPVGGSTSLSFTINNPNASVALTGVAFTDTLPAGLFVATPNGLTGSCGGGTITAAAGATSASLSGASLAFGASCTFSINVTGTTAGIKSNSVQVTAANAGTGNTSNASVTVVAPPLFSKAFGALSIPLNGSTSLTFAIQNTNGNTTLTGIGFSDTLPAALVVASPNGLSNTCGGTPTAIAGSNSFSLSGATVANSGQCIVVINVTGIAAGTASNTTGNVTSTEGGTGGTATASIAIVAPPAIAKSFTPPNIQVGGTSTLTVTITNPAANTVAEAGVAVSDTLPSGMVVATPNGLTSSCGGTPTATAGSGSVSLTGGTIAVGSNCTVSVNVTSSQAGVLTNTTGAVSSTNGGTGSTATATLTVAAPPSIAKGFGAATIPTGGSTSLSFTINNPNASVTLTGVAFTDTLPAGLVVATPNGLTGSCGGGTITAVAGTGSASLSGASLGNSASCTFSINVTGTSAGIKNNSVLVTSTNAGSGNTSNASVTVVAPPVIAKAFGAASVPLNGSTSLTFTITNPNATVGLTGVAFGDALPSATGTVVVATPSALVSNCGGTATAVAGSNSVTLTGGGLAAGANCTISINVTGTAPGDAVNITGNVTSVEGGTGIPSNSATLKVVAPPVLSKSFTPSVVVVSGAPILSFTIVNPAANTLALTGVGFTDTLPAGVTVANPNNLTGSCGGGTITAVAGTSVISLSGATLAVSSSCTFSVGVAATGIGLLVNTTGAVTSNEGGTGNTASANLSMLSSVSGLGRNVQGGAFITRAIAGKIAWYDASYAKHFSFGSLGSGPGQFNPPSGVAMMPNGYIAVSDPGNGRVVVFDANETFRYDAGSPGSGNGQLLNPTGLAVTAAGNLFVVDTGNNRVQMFDSNGVYKFKFGTLGSGKGQFNLPTGIALLPNGNIAIADTGNNRIQVFDPNATFLYQFGSFGTGNGQFNLPGGLSVDPSGNLAVVDIGNNRVQQFDVNGIYKFKFGTFGSGNGQLSSPVAVMVVPGTGWFWVLDEGNNRVEVFDNNGIYRLQFVPNP